eukprot:5127787-Pleurochrysis_carterae.AAC.1
MQAGNVGSLRQAADPLRPFSATTNTSCLRFDVLSTPSTRCCAAPLTRRNRKTQVRMHNRRTLFLPHAPRHCLAAHAYAHNAFFPQVGIVASEDQDARWRPVQARAARRGAPARRR